MVTKKVWKVNKHAMGNCVRILYLGYNDMRWIWTDLICVSILRRQRTRGRQTKEREEGYKRESTFEKLETGI
jgi:hypothetical protein